MLKSIKQRRKTMGKRMQMKIQIFSTGLGKVKTVGSDAVSWDSVYAGGNFSDRSLEEDWEVSLRVAS